MKTSNQILLDEKKFHDDIFSSKTRKKVSKYYSINGAIERDYLQQIFESPKGKSILEYGCGMGSNLIDLDQKGAATHGIDISDYAIQELKKLAAANNAKCLYQVMNAEDMIFADQTFDLIYGSGILHHLNLSRAFDSIRKKLKGNGKAVFIEPLGHNPLINGFRKKTPDIRTEDEHPLLMADLNLAQNYFNKISVQYYYLTALGLPLVFGAHTPRVIISLFNLIDKILFALIPPLRKHAWQVLIKFESPKN